MQFLNKVIAPQLESKAATGTEPLTITSTTKVTNLNADLLDGKHASDFDKYVKWVLQSGAVSTDITAGVTATFTAGTDVSLSLSGSTLTISHADIAAPASSSNSGGTVLQSITLNNNGHVTGLSTTNLDNRFLRLATADTVSAVHTFNPSSIGAPFILGANAIDQLVTGLNADKLDGNDASAFALASHTHAGGDITGTVGDADTVDGQHASEFASASHTHDGGDIGGTVGDSDTLDGYHAGNASGQIPINNGTLNVDLNADMVDGYHAGNASGNVPVSNGTVNANLNADMLDGKHASEFALAHSHPYDNYQNWYFAVNSTTQDPITSGDVLNFKAGSNVTITRSADDEITISSSYTDTNYYLSGVSHDGSGGNGIVTFTRQGLSNLTLDLSHTHSEYLTSYTNNYLTGVSGSGNGTVTFTRQGLADLTWDASHNHDTAYLSITGKAADSDKLDGLHSSSFLRSDAANTYDLRLSSGNGRGLRFWDSDSYKIWMSAATDATWGGRLDTTSDYNMYFKMTGGTNRGFVFKNDTTVVAQIDASGNGYFIGELTWSGGGSANANAAYTHISSDGSDHSYINQNVTTTATPTFAGLTINGDLNLGSSNLRQVKMNDNAGANVFNGGVSWDQGGSVFVGGDSKAVNAGKVTVRYGGRAGTSGNTVGRFELFRRNGTTDEMVMIADENRNVDFGVSVSIQSKFKLEYNATKNSLDFVYTG